jgi:hypothetical protein
MAEALALDALPAEQRERVSCAVTLVKDGKVLQLDDGTWEVESATVPGKIYYIVGQECSCEDAHFRAPKGQCKHVLSVLLSRKTMALIAQHKLQPEPSVEPTAGGLSPTPEPETPVEPMQGIDPKFIVWIQQRPFVRHAGLLKRAHECGLQSLTVEWTYNDTELSLAHAVAVFEDGRRFTESADSTPQNVGKKVALHWRRIALTRASARALRIALGCDLVAVEELEREE